MKIAAAGRLADNYLDYHRAEDEYRIEVGAMLNLRPLAGVAFVRRRSPRMLLNYLRELGPAGVVRKVRSRLAEAARNDKWLSCGLGTIIEAPEGGRFRSGEQILFIAPAHPRFAERLCLPGDLLRATRIAAPAGPVKLHADAASAPELEPFAGWTRWSGAPLPPTSAALDVAERLLAGVDWSGGRTLPGAATAIRESSRGEAGDELILFGLGNYAKTVILPFLPPRLKVTRIHEIDPTQLGPRLAPGVNWSTRPTLFEGDRPKAVLIAGFHHTHPGLAVEALRRGAYAVVEKPLITARDQLGPLVEAVAASPRLFACFHKRYSAFTERAPRDLAVTPGEAIHYHCVVFEEPLPQLHWYRWPNSGSRLVSNGCHWLDHFLFLNLYSKPVRSQVSRAADDIASVLVELENGAVFTMTLGDQGSPRLGVRDYVELRAGRRTATIVDATRYHAEDPSRVLARARVGRQESYARMYRSIGDAILAGRDGDSLDSVLVGSRLLMDLEDELASQSALSSPGRSGRSAGS